MDLRPPTTDLRPPTTDLITLMPPSHRDKLAAAKQRTTSAASQLSQISVADSTTSVTSQFLENRAALLLAHRDYAKIYLDGLGEIQDCGNGDRAQIEEMRGETLAAIQPVMEELDAVRKSQHGMQQDMNDHIDIKKRHRSDTAGPSLGMMESAYTAILYQRVAECSAKQKPKKKFNQSAFRSKALEYYNAKKFDEDGRQWNYCHLTGWWVVDDKDRRDVIAAHLVPKALSEKDLTYLFGSNENNAMHSPRNSLMLHVKMENALDNGDIAIVPIPPDEEHPETRWKCLLVNQELRDKIACGKQIADFTYVGPKWRDLDGKVLEFKHDVNRPAKRFLYFRFIMTYLMAKKSRMTDFTDNVEAKSEVWASPGPYLRQSTLIAVARQISGCQLPESIYHSTTFVDPPGGSDDDAENMNMGYTIALHQAIHSTGGLSFSNGNSKDEIENRSVDENQGDDEDDDDEEEK